jgi:hypothetical protein
MLHILDFIVVVLVASIVVDVRSLAHHMNPIETEHTSDRRNGGKKKGERKKERKKEEDVSSLLLNKRRGQLLRRVITQSNPTHKHTHTHTQHHREHSIGRTNKRGRERDGERKNLQVFTNCTDKEIRSSFHLNRRLFNLLLSLNNVSKNIAALLRLFDAQVTTRKTTPRNSLY